MSGFLLNNRLNCFSQKIEDLKDLGVTTQEFWKKKFHDSAFISTLSGDMKNKSPIDAVKLIIQIIPVTNSRAVLHVLFYLVIEKIFSESLRFHLVPRLL